MTHLQLANFLQFVVVVGFWIFVFCKMIPTWRLDSFRQDMFEVRDQLFDYAADGNISFDHPAYVLQRRQLNGLIRHGHQLTVFRGLMTIAIHKVSGVPAAPGDSWGDAWQKALNTIEDSSVRGAMEQFHRRGMTLVIGHLVTGSPLLWVMTLGYLVEFVFRGVRQTLMQSVKNAAKKAFSAGPINDQLIEEAAQGEFA
jgi:hypothetical protein